MLPHLFAERGLLGQGLLGLTVWAALGAGLAQAQTAGQTFDGVLSMVDIDTGPTSGLEPSRAGQAFPARLAATLPGSATTVYPLVEVKHFGRWQACAQRNAGQATFDDRGCQQFEWSVPFISEADAQRLEEALSKAWNTFDARAEWHLSSQLNALPDEINSFNNKFSRIKNCLGDPTKRLDSFLGAWDGPAPKGIETGAFCDGLDITSTLVPSYVPGTPCPLLDAATNWAEVDRRWRAAYQHALDEYYPDYWDEVNRAVRAYMPMALKWDGLYPFQAAPGTERGSLIQPVYAARAKPAMYEQLAAQAQRQDRRGALYTLQSYPYQAGLRSYHFSPAQLRARLAQAQGERSSAQWPGVPTLEVQKYSLARREDLFTRPQQWASPGAAQPRGEDGAGDLRETEGVGAVAFVRLYGRADQETTPRPVMFERTCLKPTPFGPVKVLVERKMPSVMDGVRKDASIGRSLTRAHVEWMSVPEGYPIYKVRGIPKLMQPTDETASDGPLKFPKTAGVGPDGLPKTRPQVTQPPPAAPPPTTTPQPQTDCDGKAVPGGTKPAKTRIQCLAELVLKNSRITLGANSSTRGGSPRQNVQDVANGKIPVRGCHHNVNCGLHQSLPAETLQAMLDLARLGSFIVTAIEGGDHSATSDHYAGLAIDLGTWNGVSLSRPNQAHEVARNACISVGSNPLQTFNAYHDIKEKIHTNHVHCSFN